MYYIAFARYDYWGDSYVDSGRLSYLTDSESDAERYWAGLEDDPRCSIRRGGIHGPFHSLKDPELVHTLLASDTPSAKNEELMDVAHYLGWGRDDTPVPLLLQADPVRPALERPGVTYRKDLA